MTLSSGRDVPQQPRNKSGVKIETLRYRELMTKYLSWMKGSLIDETYSDGVFYTFFHIKKAVIKRYEIC